MHADRTRGEVAITLGSQALIYALTGVDTDAFEQETGIDILQLYDEMSQRPDAVMPTKRMYAFVWAGTRTALGLSFSEFRAKYTLAEITGPYLTLMGQMRIILYGSAAEGDANPPPPADGDG